MDAASAEQLFINFLSRLGNGFLSLLGLTAILISIFFQSRIARLSSVLSELSSLPFHGKDSVGADVVLKISQYARAYKLPVAPRLIVLALFSVGAITCVSTWVVILLRLAPAGGTSVANLTPVGLGTVFLVLLFLTLFKLFSPGLGFFGVDLPEPEKLGQLPVLMRLCGVSAQTLLRHAGVRVGANPEGSLFLDTNTLWLSGFRFIVCLHTGREHAPRTLEEVLSFSGGLIKGANRGQTFVAGLYSMVVPGWVHEVLPAECLPGDLGAAKIIVYVCYEGQEYPLAANMAIRKIEGRLVVEPRVLQFWDDHTCVMRDTVSLRAQHPVLEALRHRHTDFALALHSLPAEEKRRVWATVAEER